RIQLRRQGSVERLEVRWDHYAPPQGLPPVTLVNMVHLGDHRFFEETQQFLDGYELVFMEGVRGEHRSQISAAYNDLATHLRMSTQSEVMKRRPHFRFHDVESSEMSSAIFGAFVRLRRGVSMLQRQIAEQAEDYARDYPDLGPEERQRAAARGPIRRELAESLSDVDYDDPDLIGGRNEMVLSAVEAELAKSGGHETIAICYGASHATGLAARLETWGYQLTSFEWRPVFSAYLDVREAAAPSPAGEEPTSRPVTTVAGPSPE
ncbi:MAG: hypothetical protein KDB53_04615, partial [Planctomycetes bacterium]|nr:hypothetical protein [Planctomycetota bacterium]